MKKYRSVISHETEENFEEKLTLDSKNNTRKLVNFNASRDKYGNLHFHVLLLPIANKFSAQKVQKNDLSWHWKKMKILKKNWLFIWKMTWRILVNINLSSGKSENLKFCRKYVLFELKRYRGTALSKTAFGFKNDISNLINLHTSSWE